MSFESPIRLLALLVVPAVIALAILAARRRGRYPVAFTNLAVLAEVAPARRRPLEAGSCRSRSSCSRSSSPRARSRSRASRLSEPDQNATIVLLVDVSGSMRASDVEPTPARRRGRRDDDVPATSCRSSSGSGSSRSAPSRSRSSRRPPTATRSSRRSTLLEPEAGHRRRRRDRRAPSTCSPPRCTRTGTCASRASPSPARSSSSPTAPRTGGSSSPQQAARAGEGRGRPRLPGLARHAERDGHLRDRARSRTRSPCRPTRRR